MQMYRAKHPKNCREYMGCHCHDSRDLKVLAEEIVGDNFERMVANAMKWGMEAQKRADMHRLKLSENGIFYSGERFDDAEKQRKPTDLGWGA